MIYAGIDEAGYGPMFGPLLVARSVLAIDDGCALDAVSDPQDERLAPDAWLLLAGAVCRKPNDRRGRIAVNDSKKLHSQSAGVSRLEMGVLSFASVAGVRAATVDRWLDALGEQRHHALESLPWYCPSDARPWATMPTAISLGELAIARGMLARCASQANVNVNEIRGAVVYEDQFNTMVSATRSKAAASFAFVARHLREVWEEYPGQAVYAAVDRQSGRKHYREDLSHCFPEAHIRIAEESDRRSLYVVTDDSRHPAAAPMRVSFEVDADGTHLPVALASMTAKYTRELLMDRFRTYFQAAAPRVKPTAGYARDAKRFWSEIQPTLQAMNVEPARIRRSS